MRRLALLLCLAAAPAGAHPHIYIDAGLHPIFDRAGRLVAVRVIWAYDDLYSSLIFEDRGVDPDMDGVLTPEETALLQGFDMAWEPGFEGDLEVRRGDDRIALSGPTEPTAAVIAGQIVTTHVRRFAEPLVVGADPVVFAVYDPTFYSAYTIALGALPEGREDCKAELYEPDVEAAYEILGAAIEEMGAERIANGDFPAVGAIFAEELRLSCPPRA